MTLADSRSRPRSSPAPRLLITAGPTYEPIDAVRFLGNRSSGRMGIALAEAGAELGWRVTLLLGPATQPVTPTEDLRVHRFQTCEDLRTLLAMHAPEADVVIMAAAVADYRPKPNPALAGGKFRRTSGPVMLELEPTPDLLAEATAKKRPDQLFVGFALEPRAELLASAAAKLARKKVQFVVANPLETMDSPTIEATVLSEDGSRESPPPTSTGSLPTKPEFARWLLKLLARHLKARASAA